MSGIGRQTHCDYQCRMTQFSFYQASKVGMSVTPHGRTESLEVDRLYPTHSGRSELWLIIKNGCVSRQCREEQYNQNYGEAQKTHRLCFALLEPLVCLSSTVNQYLIWDHSK